MEVYTSTVRTEVCSETKGDRASGGGGSGGKNLMKEIPIVNEFKQTHELVDTKSAVSQRGRKLRVHAFLKVACNSSIFKIPVLTF